VADVLSDMAELWGPDRPAAVCRELTKTYEEVKRGTVAELAIWAGDGVKGEITVVVQGASLSPQELTDDEIKDAVRAVEAQGSTRRDAVDAVAAQTGLPRRRVYNASLT
jgi:16S rRNA (cytidine1402-2'-O)-methyltransferase